MRSLSGRCNCRIGTRRGRADVATMCSLSWVRGSDNYDRVKENSTADAMKPTDPDRLRSEPSVSANGT